MTNNALRRLQGATIELARATPIKQRLSNAFSTYFKDMDLADVPLELRDECRAILDGLECVPALRGETPVQATVRKMSPDQAEDYARRIVTLFTECARAPSAAVLEWKAHRDGRESQEARYPDSPAGSPLRFVAEA